MNKLNKKIGVTAAFLGALTIAIGAFGAHGLKQLVDDASIQTFETGVRYQMFHVLALLVLSFAKPLSEVTLRWVFRFFVGGIVLFSGSIYLLVLKDFLPISSKIIGPITPLGGLLFIGGWICLCYGIYKLK